MFIYHSKLNRMKGIIYQEGNEFGFGIHTDKEQIREYFGHTSYRKCMIDCVRTTQKFEDEILNKEMEDNGLYPEERFENEEPIDAWYRINNGGDF